jgi:dTDP-4-dehydrorhamnose 3,5-epimerase
MQFVNQKIPDVILIKPDIHGDKRGYFVETFRRDLFEGFLGHKINFIQDCESKSSKGVLRGLHYQLAPYTQAKLIRVIDGSILDVAVDIRRYSPTFGCHVALELSGENKKQLFIPRGFAHGFLVLSESATVVYKLDNYYAPANERGIAFDDVKLGIDWKLAAREFELSDKDKKHPNLSDVTDFFD